MGTFFGTDRPDWENIAQSGRPSRAGQGAGVARILASAMPRALTAEAGAESR